MSDHSLPASRRAFVGAITAASYSRILGANDRIGIGFLGAGLIGLRHIEDFKAQRDAALVAVCDVYQPRVERGQANCGPGTKGYADFRKLLEDNDVQAVVVSTPDHWHALHAMLACAAGKDVYVEKPMTLFVREGRWMTDVARRYKRIVQVGTQGRSGVHVREVQQLIRDNHIGKIHSVRIGAFRNIMPGFGTLPETDSPTDLDYEMWLGPAPKRPFKPHRGLYHFRWFWDYSGGQMTNLGSHDLDFVHLLLKLKGPNTAYSTGGRFVLEDDGETPDTQDALLEYPGLSVLISLREGSAGRRHGSGTEFFGTRGSMVVGRGGFEVYPDMEIAPERQIPPWSNPPGHPQPKDIKPAPRTQARQAKGTSDEPMDMHVRNFLDCVKSRQRPNADVEDGHQVSAACHLANIAFRLQRKIRWDPEKEQIAGDKEASAHLVRPYRKPWDEVLHSLKV
jgi:predicted dehydrogenase